MLDAMRRGAQTWVAKILFGLLVLSFAIWGVADVFTGAGRGAIAKVGDTAITAAEFDRAFKNEIETISREAKQRLSNEQARALGLDRRVLNQMIGGAAIESHATDLGLALSESALAEGLQNDPDFKGSDGKFSRDGFASLLRQLGLSEQGFLALRRKDELRTAIIGAFVSGTVVPQPFIELQNNFNQEKRTLEWVNIDAAKLATVPEPDDAKLKELYEANKSIYMTQELRKFGILTLAVDDLKKQVEVSDSDIAAEYDRTKESYDTAEQRRVQQIAFKDRATAEAAKAALDGGKSFGDVAKDAGAKDTDVDLGLLAKSTLIDPKIADVAFAIEKDKVSDVVEGRFATVLLRVTQIEPGVKRQLGDVRDQVRDRLATERAALLLQAKHDDVDDNRGAGKTLSEIAETLRLTYKTIDGAARAGNGANGQPVLQTPDLPKIMDKVFAPADGSETEAIELADGGYAWISQLGTEPPKQQPFEEVKAEVKDRFMQSERSRLLTDAAKKLTERVNAGEPMSAIEADAGGKAEKTEPITRSTVPQGLSQTAVAQSFQVAAGRAIAAESADKSTRAIVRVAEIVAAPPVTPEQAGKIAEAMKNELANLALNEYTRALQSSMNVSINETELKRALGLTDQ